MVSYMVSGIEETIKALREEGCFVSRRNQAFTGSSGMAESCVVFSWFDQSALQTGIIARSYENGRARRRKGGEGLKRIDKSAIRTGNVPAS